MENLFNEQSPENCRLNGLEERIEILETEIANKGV